MTFITESARMHLSMGAMEELRRRIRPHTYYEDISLVFLSFLSSLFCLSEPRCLCFSFRALHSQNGYVKPATMEGLADISLDAVR